MTSLKEPVDAARRRSDRYMGSFKRAIEFSNEMKRMELKALLRRQHQALRLSQRRGAGQ